MITKVDRLARSLLDLITIADELRAAGITLEVLSGTFNRDDPMGEAFFQMTGVFAQLERDLIRQRTHEGLEAARARGRTGGRKAKLTDAQAAEVCRMYAAREKTVAEIGALFGITRESVYRYVRRRPRTTSRPQRSRASGVCRTGIVTTPADDFKDIAILCEECYENGCWDTMWPGSGRERPACMGRGRSRDHRRWQRRVERHVARDRADSGPGRRAP